MPINILGYFKTDILECLNGILSFDITRNDILSLEIKYSLLRSL